MASRIRFTSDSLTPGLAKAPEIIQKRIEAVMQYEAAQAQNAMRTNAPWTDQTGNARGGLFAQSGRTGTTHYMVLYHTVPYGLWLEVLHNGRYAVVIPMLKPTLSQVMQDLRKVMR